MKKHLIPKKAEIGFGQISPNPRVVRLEEAKEILADPGEWVLGSPGQPTSPKGGGGVLQNMKKVDEDGYIGLLLAKKIKITGDTFIFRFSFNDTWFGYWKAEDEETDFKLLSQRDKNAV